MLALLFIFGVNVMERHKHNLMPYMERQSHLNVLVTRNTVGALQMLKSVLDTHGQTSTTSWSQRKVYIESYLG